VRPTAHSGLAALFAAATMLLSGCVEPLDIDPVREEPQVVVSCILSNSDTQHLELTYTNPPSGSSFTFPEVEDATATLYCEGSAVGTFRREGPTEWVLNYRPEEEKDYRLEVKVPGHPLITATTTMPQKPPFEQLRHYLFPNDKFSQGRLTYPCWVFALNSSLKSSDEYNLEINQPAIEEDPDVSLIEVIGSTHKDEDQFNSLGGTLSWSVTKDVVTPHYCYVRLIPNPDRSDYIFTLVYHVQSRVFIVFRTASEEYDRYLKSVCQKIKAHLDEDDPVQWFEQIRIYSNIENGLGIFGAYNQISYYRDHTYTIVHDEEEL
jgi:hypothetical protein